MGAVNIGPADVTTPLSQVCVAEVSFGVIGSNHKSTDGCSFK